MAKYADFLKLWKNSDILSSMKAAGVKNKDILNIRKNLYNADADKTMLDETRAMFSGVGDVRNFGLANRYGIFRGTSKETQNILATKLADAEHIQQVEADALKKASPTNITDHDIANVQAEALKEGFDFKEAIEARDDKERKVAANIAEVDRLTEKMNAIRSNPLRQDPMAMRVARKNNIDIDTPEGRKFISDAIQGNARQQELTKSQEFANDYYDKRNQIQKSLETGSGKSIQESVQETANSSAAAADTSGGPVDMTIDRAILRQKMGGDKTTWGRKDAEEYLLNNVTKKLEDQQLAIAQNKKLTSEQRIAAWNKNKKEAEDILAEGPGVGDYFFGNKLHHSAIGAVALFGAGSAAFGGHKSNAELYSSPF